MATPEPDVDALRAKLKSLGYLDAGVDRFVLAPAKAGRSPWGLASRSSLRIAILAGLLLGLSGALAAGVRVPGLITGVRDTFVLATMLAVAFGLAVGVISLAAILVAARAVRWLGPRASLARRVRPLSLAAGGLVGAVCLAYLTLWWGAMDTVPDERSGWVTFLALVVAAAVSVLLGHATTTTAQAVITNEWPDTDVPPRRPTSLRGSVALAGAAVAVAGSALLLSPGREVTRDAPPALTVIPTGARVIVFGVDGFDDSLAAKYVPDHGEPLALSPLRAMPRQSEDPAREWTTIATGQPVERHGVTALEVRRIAGLEGQLPTSGAGSRWSSAVAAATDLLRLTRPTINTGAIRREKTFWEVAAQAGLRTVAVNWWTSWPAREEDGVVLTERAVLRLEAGGELAAEIVPASLYQTLRQRWPELGSQATALAASVVEEGAGMAAPAASLAASLSPGVAQVLREAATVDAQQLVLFRTVASPDVDLATVYLPGLDILGTKLRALSGAQGSTATLVESAEAVRRYYLWLARQMYATAGAFVVPRPNATPPLDGVAVLVVGHPGRAGAQSPAIVASWWMSDTPPADPRPPAAPTTSQLPPVRPATPGTLFDVAPTVLQLLGVPLSQELPGRGAWPAARTRLGRPDEVGADKVVTGPTPVPTYGRRGTSTVRAARPGALDEEMRERLRSLGYVR